MCVYIYIYTCTSLSLSLSLALSISLSLYLSLSIYIYIWAHEHMCLLNLAAGLRYRCSRQRLGHRRKGTPGIGTLNPKP